MTDPHLQPPRAARRAVAAVFALVGTLVWTHALAGVARAMAGIPAVELASASLALSVAAVLTALAGAIGSRSGKRAALFAGLAGLAGAVEIGRTHPGLLVPAAALVPAGIAFAGLGAWFARRLPATLDDAPARHPVRAAAWVALALVAVVQVGRLSTWVSDRESDWFVSTRHPFYAKHECLNAYVFGAELDRRGESNVYDPRLYPGLNPGVQPRTEMVGMSPEDPFQYPPPFLLLPRLAIEATHDYDAIRSAWFGLNATLCLGALLALATWIGGRAGTVAGLLSPAVLASFPVLYDLQYGQFHFAAIALAVLGLLALERGRAALGGSLLAGAILSKLFPAVLLLPLAVQRRWRDLGWTALAGGAMTAAALLVLGSAPFSAFLGFHLPRLGDGSAFAFGEAWPEVADLIVAGNQGVHGIVHKLGAMGFAWADDSAARIAGDAFAALLAALACVVGLRARGASREARAASWLGLVGLASLLSTGAWADYVPLTCVWLLAVLAPLAPLARRPALGIALGVCALLQVFLLGTIPIGAAADPFWMLPVSLVGALALVVTFAGAALVPAFGERVEPAVRLRAAVASSDG